MAPLISFPNNGTKTKSKINKKHKAFNIFLRLFLGSNDKKINTRREKDKKIICLNISSIEYSVPINE